MFVVLFTTFLLAAFFLSAKEEDKEEAQTSKSFRSKMASILRILAVILDDDDDDDDDDDEETTTILFIFFAYFCDFFVRLFVLNLDFQTAHICRETTSNFCFKRGNALIVCKRAVHDAETSHCSEPAFVHHLYERKRDFE